MKLKNYKKRIDSIPDETRSLVKFNMNVLDRINELLELKFEGKQKLLAEKMGKTEPEISKWLNGYQNFTVKTLIKLEIAFGEPIIAVCTDGHHDSTFVLAKTPIGKTTMKMEVNKQGAIEEVSDCFVDVNTSIAENYDASFTPIS